LHLIAPPTPLSAIKTSAEFIAKSPVHILIVEDDLAIATNLYDFLEARGHSLDGAADGITGLHLAVTQKFDVILLDLSLPVWMALGCAGNLRKEADKRRKLTLRMVRKTQADQSVSHWPSNG
jgi:DNA-binding response OmpR family regulator